MAIVQISKIQLRRGKKNSESGVPQLSSAEMAWAVDSQELFIGNGSVAEGAPEVGNTKILTEHDNILELVSGYQYAADNNAISFTVTRSIQSKIDEIEVSVTDFGAQGNDAFDNSESFKNAIDQLFKNADTKYRKILKVPNGVYFFASDLRIPSGVEIRGENSKETILNLHNSNVRFTTVNDLDISTNPSLINASNRPRDVHVSNITILREQGQILLSGLSHSRFTQVTFQGTYEFGSNISNLNVTPGALQWTNINAGTSVDNIEFTDCTFKNNAVSLKMIQTSDIENSSIKFNDCKFFRNFTGVYLETAPIQRHLFWEFNDCVFEEITASAVKSLYGSGTTFNRTKFLICGNGSTNNSLTPQFPIVEFGKKENIISGIPVRTSDWRGNVLIDCYSDRQKIAGIVDNTLTDFVNENTVAVSEVLNGDKVEFINRNTAPIGISNSPSLIALFSSNNRFYNINYQLKLGSYSRNGKLTISVDDLRENIAITDHYQYSPLLQSDPGGVEITKFEFSVGIRDNDNNGSNETILLYYINPETTLIGELSFDVTYGI